MRKVSATKAIRIKNRYKGRSDSGMGLKQNPTRIPANRNAQKNQISRNGLKTEIASRGMKGTTSRIVNMRTSKAATIRISATAVIAKDLRSVDAHKRKKYRQILLFRPC